MFRYIGSKSSTANSVVSLVDGLRKVATVADAYGGLGTVGSALKAGGYTVSSCDALVFPHMFQIARIEYSARPAFRRLCREIGAKNVAELQRELGSANARDNWFCYEYSDRRAFFSMENAKAISGAWELIRRWNEAGLLSRKERAFLVASFLNSMDAVANTAGTYYAHLKELYRKAKRPFQFSWVPTVRGNNGLAKHGDALTLLQGESFDLLYLDPPYNKRNYAAYYHLPETLALLSERLVNPASRAGMPIVPHGGSDSIRCGTDLAYICKLAESVSWKYLMVHYCDNAHIPLDRLREALLGYGKVSEHFMDALGYTTSKTPRKTTHHVFLVRS